jgi:hypothetical protein
MVRISVLLFLLIVGESELEVLPISNVNPSIVYKERHFNRVYEQIRSHEGGYVFHPNDRGGMTYGGIARRLHPKWQGWYLIDQAQPLKRYDSVERAEWLVKDFYLTLWITGGYEKIENFDLALNLFDFAIHSSPRTVELKVNRVLAKYGCDPIRVQSEWIPDYINTLPANEFILHLKIERIKLFNYLVTKDPSQMVFLKGWYDRIEKI